MKKALLLTTFVGILMCLAFYAAETDGITKTRLEIVAEEDLKDGDIIFQTSSSSQCLAIQAATKSKYTHCGLVYKEGNSLFVLEAVQPVRSTPLKEWIKNGNDSKYAVKRLKNASQVLTPEVIEKMKELGFGWLGKNYDLTFGWSDERIYCSELVWKLYQRSTGLEVGKLAQLKDFDLSSPIVKQKLKERYGNNIPMEETVISPGAIFDSELLVTVKSTY